VPARREILFAELVTLADAATLVVSLVAACALYGHSPSAKGGFWDILAGHLTVLWVALALWTFLARRLGLTNSNTYSSLGRLCARTLRVHILGGVGLMSAEFLTNPAASRLFTFEFLAASFVALSAEKLGVRAMLLYRAERKRARGHPRALVVGIESLAGTYFDLLRTRRFWPVTIADFIPWDEAHGHLNGNGNGNGKRNGASAGSGAGASAMVPRSTEQWDKLIGKYLVDEVVAVMPWNRAVDTEALSAACARRGVTFRQIIQMPPAPAGRYCVEDLGAGRYMLSLETVPEPTLALLLKRVIDVLGATIGLVLCGIAYLWYAPRLKRESPGPVLFVQPRVGENGRVFNLCKFRTMCPDAEERLPELLKHNQMDGYMFKIKDDPRVTPSGRILRRRHLDEMPQFWNVLKGEMSLVGTRPPTLNEVAQYKPHHYRRLSMKPGITGLWQINGNGEVREFEDVVKLDCQYIDNWALATDFKILAKTAMKVIRGTGW
jgi:exopolysaccharide biosynthesis polyprenyl glycosylphosphotransferase